MYEFILQYEGNLQYLIDEASQIVLKNDRQKYDCYFKTAEIFCNKNNILLGGQIGINLLTKSPLNKDTYQYYLYTDNAFEMSKKLVIELYNINSSLNPPEGLTRGTLPRRQKHPRSSKEPNNFKETIHLDTVLTHKEFNIYINTILLFKIFALDTYKNVRLYDLIGPISTKGYFSNVNVQVISGEVYLIDIYRKLYTPYAEKIGGYKTYSYFRDIEKKVYPETIKFLEDKIIGGDTGINISDSDKKSELEDIKNILLKEYISKSDNILIGDYTNDSEHIKRLQIISNSSPDDIKEIIIKVIKNNLQINKNIIYQSFNLNLPDDFRIKKYTFYISDNKGDNIPLMDVFNSSSFELIPYKNTFIKLKDIKKKLHGTCRLKIGGLYVLIRFKFIDLWSMKLIYNLGTSDINFVTRKIKEIIKDIQILHENINNTDPSNLFQLENYIGEYNDEIIAKKKIISEVKFKHKKIYPSKLT